MVTKKNIVIVGNGMVSNAFINYAVKNSLTEYYNLFVIGDEPYPAYDRIALNTILSGNTIDSLSLSQKTETIIPDNVVYYTSELVVDIDLKNKEIKTSKMRTMSFDKLIIATGSNAIKPPVEGVDVNGVFTYRNYDDVKRIESYCRGKSNALVVGGGLLGIESAGILKKLGLSVTIIERSTHLMSQQMNKPAGKFLCMLLEQKGYVVNAGSSIVKINSDANNNINSVVLDNSEVVNYDIVIIAVGIAARVELAKRAGLRIAVNGGISVSKFCLTSDENIYAIGECASVGDKVYGLVAPGYQMARVVADHLMSIQNSFENADISTKLKFSGIDVGCIGSLGGIDESKVSYVEFIDNVNNVFKSISLHKESKKILSATLIGDTSSYSNLKLLHQINDPIANSVDRLLMGDLKELNVAECDDDTIICSCNNVSKSDLLTSIDDNHIINIQSLIKHTDAGSGCTGCMPNLKAILKHRIKSNAWEIQGNICEHFDYTRQELFDLIVLKQYDSFSEVIENEGTGSGCAICKPLVSSILSSTKNKLIAENTQFTAQDINEKFLANIQKDGTYSIIPRIFGGEITHEKLKQLAEIAEKYSLYIRITGGQRISFFGAHLQDLPDIWRLLVDAGFESGHAYGKALRTVKTCVGSTWCPWGIQDSTSFAVKLEQRYRGLHSPHKLKSGVSGCIRDCAESKIKDFGLVATRQGWNLFVAGNGGRDLERAQLLAEDLTEELVIKYTDRFLMYYIKTSDHLTRTAVWLKELEGGIEHVKNVVIRDSLGIAEQLESEMKNLIQKSQCEWKSVIDRDDLTKKYRHYVNSSNRDPDIVHVKERGQVRPIESKQITNLVKYTTNKWHRICKFDDVLPESGICALIDSRDVAIFRAKDKLYSIDNHDPLVNVSVLSRGIVGDSCGEPIVVSPLSRKHFSLETGCCIGESSVRVNTYSVRNENGYVEILMN